MNAIPTTWLGKQQGKTVMRFTRKL